MQFQQLMFESGSAAVAALDAVGARYDPRLDLTTDVAGLGKVHRRFGILGNPLQTRDGGDQRILAPFRVLLDRPENDAAARRLREENLPFCPANKQILGQIRERLLAMRIHLPWALRPMNMDFMAVASRAHRAGPFPFRTFYSEQVVISGGEVTVRRLFSMPMSGQAEATILEPDEDAALDLHVGVVLETGSLVL